MQIGARHTSPCHARMNAGARTENMAPHHSPCSCTCSSADGRRAWPRSKPERASEGARATGRRSGRGRSGGCACAVRRGQRLAPVDGVPQVEDQGIFARAGRPRFEVSDRVRDGVRCVLQHVLQGLRLLVERWYVVYQRVERLYHLRLDCSVMKRCAATAELFLRFIVRVALARTDSAVWAAVERERHRGDV